MNPDAGVSRFMRSACALVLAAVLCSCSDPTPVETTLPALKTYQLDFHGKHVRVSGTLRTFESPRHYWIENEARDRVALSGNQELAPLVGQVVEVSGIFTYDRDAGRRIEVMELKPLRASQQGVFGSEGDAGAVL